MINGDDIICEYFDTSISKEFLYLISGEEIGRGVSRSVRSYACGGDNLVLKFELRNDYFQNTSEWLLWHEVKDIPKFAKWLSPCIDISHSGSVLIQKRTQPPGPDFKWPKKLPEWLALDCKQMNWGLLDGKLVCHDYGVVKLHEVSASTKLVPVIWWEDD